MSQIGDVIVGTTDALSPIMLQTRTTVVVRTLTLPPGTWLLNALVNAKAQQNPVNMSQFSASFSGGVSSVERSGLTTNIINSYFGTCLSGVVQATGAATTIDLEVNSTFTTSNTGEFLVSNTDDGTVSLTAVRLA